MTRLAHISDVHFGREDGALVEALLAKLVEVSPDVIVVSGDLTQRARKGQFRKARAFLRALPAVPTLVVPGNHDVPATNLFARLTRPLKRYRKFIEDDLTPYVELNEVAIAGISTVRRLEHKDGRINRKQVETACEQLGRAPHGTVRVVVTHHPIDLPPEDDENAAIARAPMALRAFARHEVDLFLSGHIHTAHAIVTSTHSERYSAVIAHAGTAVSTRTRGEPNGWNLIDLNGRSEMTVRQMWAKQGTFVAGAATRFTRGPHGWSISL